ncbi:ACT domain-containing protein [Ascidiaceihabitans sp.]|uniref:ACT domain-containing protein n=1 Tax=Ascidiaceihabitans sp. TaxID=1872644 RepID=UPI0032995CF7
MTTETPGIKTGELELSTLLKTLKATLVDGVYVFVTRPPGSPTDHLPARMVFHEAEGPTLIMLQKDAEKHALDHAFACRMITLDVHSALEAVGFMAVIATKLAAHDMGVNPVAGFFHDHVFVPEDKADEAMQVLAQIAIDAQTTTGA